MYFNSRLHNLFPNVEIAEKHLAEGKRLNKKFKFSEVLQSYNDSLNKEEERIKMKLITKKSKNVL